ncbi:MAG TPA: tetratricopeptide repeat protein [Polyangiaceae bacterium]|nr:tetratricopeptide repeat protein [Polyangiaceae bacterium]
MTRSSVPEIPQAALRSHAQPERVERVWQRLALDSARQRRRPLARSVYFWAPAAAAAIFGLGVMVGVRAAAPVAEPRAFAEPRPPLPTPGAAPVVERRATEAERSDTPTPKHARPVPVPPLDEVAAPEVFPESFGEPVILPAIEPAPVPVTPVAWEGLAEAGDFQAAKDALDREGGFDLSLGRASASQLMVLADIARASGNREQAMRALKRVLAAYVSAPEAPIAAWTLGNLLDQSGDRAGAADAYATYRRLSPTGDFAEDAAARQVDVALSQGNLELAARAVDEYAQNFPKGRRLAELRKRLAALAAPSDASGASGTEPEEEDDASEPGADAPAEPPKPARPR